MADLERWCAGQRRKEHEALVRRLTAYVVGAPGLAERCAARERVRRDLATATGWLADYRREGARS